jgi:hypothetical protein
VTREIVSRWETGKRVPGLWWLRHLATVLQTPLEILERTGVDRRRFLTEVYGASIAPLVASDLIEHGFAAALHGGYPSRVFDAAGSDDAESDYAVPWWRFNIFISLMAARLGDEHVAVQAQDEADRTLPESLPRFRTHLEMHRGLMLARAGDREAGTAYARAALDALPAKKHSLTLRMLMTEIERP